MFQTKDFLSTYGVGRMAELGVGVIVSGVEVPDIRI